jgi:hypothetical protein
MCDRMKAQQTFDAGRFDEAAAQFAEQHARGKRYGLHYADLYYVLQALALQWERQGLDELPAAPASGDWDITRTTAFRATRLFVAACAGPTRPEPDADLEQLAHADFAAVPRDLNYLGTMSLLAHVVVVRKDLPRARTLYAALAPYAGRVTISLLSQTAGAVAHYLGELAVLLDQPVEAARHFDQALALNQRMGLATWTVRTQIAYAELLVRATEPEAVARGRQLLRKSEVEARELGLAPLTTRVTTLLAG